MTLAPRRSESLNLAIVTQAVERIVLVEDYEMAAAARWLWRETGVAAELSGAAAVVAILAGRYCPAAGERVCAVVCGAGTDGFICRGYRWAARRDLAAAFEIIPRRSRPFTASP